MGTRFDEAKHLAAITPRRQTPPKTSTDDGRGYLKTTQFPVHANKRYACNVEWRLDTKTIIQREVEEIRERVKWNWGGRGTGRGGSFKCFIHLPLLPSMASTRLEDRFLEPDDCI